MHADRAFRRITLFYVINLLLIGLIVPSNDPNLLNASNSSTKFSPFVIAIKEAGIQGLPSVFNAVITISVLSVANSCTFGSTRTLQALSAKKMAPKFLAYVDKAGRPIWCVLLQLAFGCLAFINEASQGDTFFTWLLSLSGLSELFIWGTICLSHIRFRAGWKAQGHTLDELPYRATFGVWGSAYGLLMNILCLMATFYSALYPADGGGPTAQGFFEQYLAAPLILFFYLVWKFWTRDWTLYVKASEMDVTSGMRLNIDHLREISKQEHRPATLANLPYRMVRMVI